MLKLSIVIVNYNTRDLLEELLSFLSEAKYSFSFEVIVVDNNSPDGSSNMIRNNYPNMHLICNSENTGFARACNMGIECTCGEYVLFLNPDTKILDDALQTLVLFLDTHAQAGVVSGRVVYPDMTDQGVARKFPTPMNSIFGRKSVLTRIFPNNKYAHTYLTCLQYESGHPFEVDWVSGACLMVRKQILDDVGFFDEKFFMYWEDADLCYRIKEKGWKVFCVANAIIIHYEGKSTGKKKAHLIVEFNKSAYHYYRKHHIKRLLGVKNLIALLGLTTRTMALLFINICKQKKYGTYKGIGFYEKSQ